jgi:hypothetical protein
MTTFSLGLSAKLVMRLGIRLPLAVGLFLASVGLACMGITESISPARVKIKLDFLKPLEGHNIAEFTLESKGDATNVTWAMYGPSPYIAKVMGLFFNMDNCDRQGLRDRSCQSESGCGEISLFALLRRTS